MKRQQLNLVLAGAVAALGAAVYFSQNKPAEKHAPLTTLKPDAISHVLLQHPGKPDIALDKKDGKWTLAAPVQAVADPFEVGSLTSLAAAESHVDIDPKDVKLAELGLDQPGFSVTLDGVRLDFGNLQPFNYRRYVAVNGRIGLIDDPPASALDADYSDLVAKNLLPENAKIASIQVPGLKLLRSADDKAWSVEPADPRAGADEMQKFADAWSGARALWNGAVPEDAKPAANTQSAVVTLKDGAVLNFSIVSRDPQLVLERADLKIRYSLAKTAVEQLLKLPESAPPPESKKVETPPVAPAKQ